MRRAYPPRALVVATAAALAVASAGCARAPARDSVTIALANDILGLDPNRDVEVITDSVLFNVYEPLVALDEDLRFRTVLAETWEHPRPEQWRIHLRRGIRFQDGTPMTAASVRDAFLSLRANPRSDAAQYLAPVQEITVVGGQVLDLVTHEPRALLASLAVLYVTKPNAKGADPPLVGTGPFRLREWRRGERVVLERWEGYWGGPPALRRATFVPVPEAGQRVARLRDGTADIAYDVPPDLAAGAPAGERFVRRTGLTVYYLGFDVRARPGNPFQDARVRRAVHLAVDREALVRGPLRGTGAVATQPVAPAVFGYKPDQPPPAHDPARSRRLLAEAGRPAGFRVRFDFPSGRAEQARFVKDALAPLGIEVELNALAGDGVYQVARAGRSAMFLIGWNCASGEASEFFEFCLRTGARGNYGGYSNPRLDAIADGNGAVPEPRDRRRLLEEAAGIAMDDLPVSPLWVADNIYGTREDVQFTPRVDGEIRLLDVRFVPR